MENSEKFNRNLETIGWGAFFILWGITAMFKTLPEGVGALGIGVILLGVNLVRVWKKLPISVFTTVLGAVAFVLGLFQLVQPVLHLAFDLPVFALLLLAFGVYLVVRSFLVKRTQA